MNRFCSVIYAIVLTLAVHHTARAAYYNLNFDYKTIAAMVAGYGAEAGTELMQRQNTSDILDKYTSAEVAAAGIFASKQLDRNALKSSKGFGDPDENYYYRKIYRLVANKIIPRTITVVQKLVKDPSTALYWGSHLMRIMADTKSLCNQFSAVVTNSTLTFNDVPFLEFTTTIANVLNLAGLGETDYESFFDSIGTIGSLFTKENLEKEYDNLQEIAVGLAGAGSETSDLFSSSTFDNTFCENVGKIIDLAENYSTLYDQFKGSAAGTLTELLTDDEVDLTKILTTSASNGNAWISSYNKSSEDRYYKQRVYIYSIDSGSEQLCAYDPPADNNSILYSDHYTRFDTNKQHYSMTYSEKQTALQNSYNHAGWSQSKVDQMNAANDGYTYKMSTWSHGYSLYNSKDDNTVNYFGYAVGYSVYVTKSWYRKEIYYEDTFDSYSNDWDLFMKLMNERLKDASSNDNSKTYHIGYDNKQYYTATNSRKLAGASTALFTLTCSGNGKIADGSVQYKCSSCGKTPNEHTKQCTMETSLSGGDYDYTELNNAISSTQSEMSSVQREIDALNTRNKEILSKLTEATNEEALALRSEYNTNRNRINELQNQYDGLNDTLNGYKNAKAEAQRFESTQTDDADRIPSIMLSVRNNFQLEWQDEGKWEGSTFVRKAKMSNLNSVVTFKATVTIERKPQYFLGIKIHRAIVKISWELVADYTDSSIIDTMQLNPGDDGEAQAAAVNQRLKELQEEYPDCEVGVTYERSKSLEEDDEDEDNIHLLWASDRMDVAREVLHRLEAIYVDLVILDKYLHYKHSVIDWLKDLTVDRLNTERGKRLTIAERSRKRWMHNAGSIAYEREEEDDNYEDS